MDGKAVFFVTDQLGAAFRVPKVTGAFGGPVLQASGIQNLKAFGFSSREAEPGIFLNKSFLYAPNRSGFLWDTFAKRPHDFPELEMVPAKAQGFAFYDFDLPLLWRAICPKKVIACGCRDRIRKGGKAERSGLRRSIWETILRG
jgi:hypothetical protein